MERRLAKLQTIWPPAPCPECAARPAIVCVAGEDDSAPCYPEGVCRRCGRKLFTVPILVGVECDSI